MRHALATEHEDLDDSSIRIEYDTMGAQEALLRQHWFALKSSPPRTFPPHGLWQCGFQSMLMQVGGLGDLLLYSEVSGMTWYAQQFGDYTG
jgi:hypothetical protein